MSVSLPTPSAARVFALIMKSLCHAVPKLIARDRSAGPLNILIWGRLRRMGTQFAALAARTEAGTLPPTRPRRTRHVRCRTASAGWASWCPIPGQMPRSALWITSTAVPEILRWTEAVPAQSAQPARGPAPRHRSPNPRQIGLHPTGFRRNDPELAALAPREAPFHRRATVARLIKPEGQGA